MKLLSLLTVLFGISANAATTTYICDSLELVNDQIIYGSDTSIEISEDGVSAQVYSKAYAPGSTKQPTYLLTQGLAKQHTVTYFSGASVQDLNISFTLTPKGNAGVLRTSGMPEYGFRTLAKSFICEKQ